MPIRISDLHFCATVGEYPPTVASFYFQKKIINTE